MKKMIVTGIVLFVCVLLPAGTGSAEKVYLDISSPFFKQIPIAVCDFTQASAEAPKPADDGITVSGDVQRYLSLAGIFNVLDKKSFLESTLSLSPVAVEKINFPNWKVIGADYLLQGNVTQSNRDIIAEIHLFDVVRATPVLVKKYPGQQDNLKTVARSIASDIMMALINDEGDFNTLVAFVSKNGLQSDIHAVNYDGTGLMKLTQHRSILLAPRWSPDGSRLAFTSFKRGRPEAYIRHLKTGEEKRLASFDGLNLCGGFSPDGKKLLLTLSKDGNEEIYMLDIDSLTLRRLTRNYSIDVSPSWSPDGQKIVFVSNRSGSPQVYTMDADGSSVKRITFEGSYNTSPSWSPRGDRIVYEGLANGRYHIFTVDEEGNNPQKLTSDEVNNESPSWSPSGRQIVYVSRKDGKSRIVIMNANGSNPRVLHEQNPKMVMPVWSPRFR